MVDTKGLPGTIGVFWPDRPRAIFALFLLSVLLCGCIAPESPPEVRTASLRSLYAQSLHVAKEWEEDSYLISARTDFALDGANSPLFISFFFLSDATPWGLLHVWYDSAAQPPRSEQLSAVRLDRAANPPIADSEWPVDSVEALEIAQAEGGAAFLMGRSTHDLRLHLHLEKQKVGNALVTVWFVYYADLTDRQSSCIQVNAVTREIVGRECKGQSP